MTPFRRRTRRANSDPVRGLLSRALPPRPEPYRIVTWVRFGAQPALWLARHWIVVGPVTLLAAIYFALFNFSVFNIHYVDVVGASDDRSAEIRAASDAYGRNIFALDEASIHDAIENRTLVRVDSIQRQVPNRLLVAVTEREPRAIWRTPAGTFDVDVDGMVLGRTRGGPGMITIVQVDGEPVEVGTRVSANAIFLAEQLKERTAQAVGANPKSYEWSPDGGLLMRTDKGWNVRFGTSADLDYKLKVWRAILDRAGAERFSATYADVRFPTRPYVRGA